MKIWIMHKGSPVKIALSPGEVFLIHEFERTEEGFSERTTEYEIHGDGLITRWCQNNWRDCDGGGRRTERDYTRKHWSLNGRNYYPLNSLDARILDWGHDFSDFHRPSHRARFPSWRQESQTRCWDEYAEAANY